MRVKICVVMCFLTLPAKFKVFMNLFFSGWLAVCPYSNPCKNTLIFKQLIYVNVAFMACSILYMKYVALIFHLYRQSKEFCYIIVNGEKWFTEYFNDYVS